MQISSYDRMNEERGPFAPIAQPTLRVIQRADPLLLAFIPVLLIEDTPWLSRKDWTPELHEIADGCGLPPIIEEETVAAFEPA